FFNNLNESVMDGNKPNPDPFIKLPSAEQNQEQEHLKKLIADGQKKIDAPMPELDAGQTAWQNQWHEKLSAGWTTLAPASVKSTASNGPTFRTLEDQSILAEGLNPESDVYEVVTKLEAGSIAALRLEALLHESMPKKTSARSEDGVFRLSEFEAEIV